MTTLIAEWPAATIRRWFRVVAIAEACSWAGLLIGMYAKYIAATTELGVKVFGPIHGGLFVAYLAGVLVASLKFGWSRKFTLVGVIASVPPFMTIIFDVFAERSGRLLTPVLDTTAP